MRTFGLSLIVAAIIAGAFLAGCQKSDETAKAEETIVKTMDEYREEAAKDITKENAEQELENLKKEVESDTGSE